jgi:hypothetical protein
MELPIVCTLTESELRERRRTMADAMRHMQVAVVPLPEGYSYSFTADSGILAEVVRLVDLERQCCQFLTFKIIVEPGNAPIRLEITGPPEARPVIAEYFCRPLQK